MVFRGWVCQNREVLGSRGRKGRKGGEGSGEWEGGKAEKGAGKGKVEKQRREQGKER